MSRRDSNFKKHPSLKTGLSERIDGENTKRKTVMLNPKHLTPFLEVLIQWRASEVDFLLGFD